jgi:hypothetical protein
MNELERLECEARRLLQETAKDQDLVDGGDGEIIYEFTYEDAIETTEDWGAVGEKPDLNIRNLFNLKKE